MIRTLESDIQELKERMDYNSICDDPQLLLLDIHEIVKDYLPVEMVTLIESYIYKYRDDYDEEI